jgi:XTP/dITP diphosphohydrolase
MDIIFATQNAHKILEIQQICPASIRIISLKELNFTIPIPETSPTIEANSLQKALFVFEHFKMPVLSEDTGLEVNALNGAPGVYTARYAGQNSTDEQNIKKLLTALKNENNRKARFKTIITYIDIQGNSRQFEGICEGEILPEKRGSDGFGYDPIFKPFGSSVSFAEMTLEQKNTFSHRVKAFRQFSDFILTQIL